MEVAHRTVFSYGHLTWEWAAGIRSYVHPLLFAALYRVSSLEYRHTLGRHRTFPNADHITIEQLTPILLQSSCATLRAGTEGSWLRLSVDGPYRTPPGPSAACGVC